MANPKIDSIRLSGSDKTFDIDLPYTATPSITGLTTSYLTATGSVIISGGNPITISGDNPLINGNTSVSVTGSVISLSSQARMDIHSDTVLRLSATNRLYLTAINESDSTVRTLMSLKASNINFTSDESMRFNLPPTTSTTTSKSRITLETTKFINDNSPCISFEDGATNLSGKIGITSTQGIGLLKIYDGSVPTDTYLTVSDNLVHMGITYSTGYSTFATFGEKFFTITLSQNLLDDGADPFMRINGTLSNFTLEFPTAQTDITIDENNVILNRITPKITTSTGNIIEYPGCGYEGASSDNYIIPSRSELKSQFAGSHNIDEKPGSTLTRCTDIDLSGDTNGAVYHIWGFESGDTGQIPGEIRVTTSGAYSSDEYTIIVAGNDVGYHGNSYISLTVIVPAGKTYYLWARCMGKMKYSKVVL